MAQMTGWKRLCSLFLAVLLAFGLLVSSGFIVPAQAGILPITRTYIQTTIDTTSWEILAGVISYEAGVGGNQVESKRVGKETLDTLAASKTPSDVADLVVPELGKKGGDQVNNLVLCFPGAMSFSGWSDNSTAEDTARAQLVRNSLIYDLNAAFKFAYGDESGTYAPNVSGDIKAQVEQYAKDMSEFLSNIPGSVGQSIGPNGARIVATQPPKNPADPGHDEYYITIERTRQDGTKDTRTFQYRMLKGYGVEGTDLPEIASDSTEYIHWGTLAVEAFVNYSSDDKLQVTVDNVYEGTPSMIESALAGVFGAIADFIANALGLWNFDELIFNSGIRGTTSYVGGAFPSSWQPIIWTFFFISEVAAIIILLYAIIYNVGKKALSTVDPVARASAIEQIKYLFIVAFLLAVIPFVIPLLMNVSAELTGMFHDALGGKTAEARFQKLATNSGGLGSAITYLVYLGALLYFNVFYVFRALALGLMTILAPLFVVMMALSENKRQLALAWFREFCANLFIQPLQALMLSFILLIPDSGRNIDSIVMAYVMIPLTNLLRQLFFGHSGGLADQIGNRGQRVGSSALRFASGLGLAGVAGALGAFGGRKGSKESSGNTEESSSGSESGSSSGAPAPSGRNNRTTGGSSSETTGSSSGPADGTAESSGGSGPGSPGAGRPGAPSDQGRERVAGGTNGPPTETSSAFAAATTAGGKDSNEDARPDGVPSEEPAGNDTPGGGAAPASGGSVGIHRFGQAAGGVALVAAGAGLGALGGMAGFVGRRYLGGAGIGRPLEQLSRSTVGKGMGIAAGRTEAGSENGANSSPSDGAEPQDGQMPYGSGRYAQSLEDHSSYKEGDNIYARGQATRSDNGDGSSTYTVARDDLKDAGIRHAGRAGQGQSAVTYDMENLNDADRGRLEEMRNVWENGSPEEKAAMQAMGIENFTPHTRMVGGQEQMTSASVTYNDQAARENLGIQSNRDGYSTTAEGDTAPAMVPDIPTKLNSQQAAMNNGVSQLNGLGFQVQASGDRVNVSATPAAFQNTEVPEELAPYFAAPTAGKDGMMTASIPKEYFAGAYGVAASDGTMMARMAAANAAPEGAAVPPPRQDAARMVSAGAYSGAASLGSQGLDVRAEGGQYIISGTQAAFQDAAVPVGMAPYMAGAVQSVDGTFTAAVPKTGFSNSYAPSAPGMEVPMATAGVHYGASSLASQGFQVSQPEGGMVSVSAPDPSAFQHVQTTPQVAQYLTQAPPKPTKDGLYMVQVPVAAFNGHGPVPDDARPGRPGPERDRGREPSREYGPSKDPTPEKKDRK